MYVSVGLADHGGFSCLGKVSMVSTKFLWSRSSRPGLGQLGESWSGRSNVGLAHTSTLVPQARGRLCPMSLKWWVSVGLPGRAAVSFPEV